MKTSFINNILNSQPILIKFALKLFVCKLQMPFFSDTFTCVEKAANRSILLRELEQKGDMSGEKKRAAL